MAISSFPISAGPISSSGLATGAPPVASVGPFHVFDEEEIKYRYGERYISEASDRKFLGIPRGAYAGFTPSVSGNVITFAIDATLSVSFARVTSQTDPLYSVDVFLDTAITMDFTGHSTFPVNVVLRAAGALGQPHGAEIITQVAPASDPTEILLCVVVNDALLHGVVTGGPFQALETVTGATSGATATVASVEESLITVGGVVGTFQSGETITGDTSGASAAISAPLGLGALYDAPTNRSTPFAFATAPLGYGFMPDGSTEDLLNAIALVAEIEAARVDLTGFTHANLGDRLTADMSASAMGGRLGKEVRTLSGGDFAVSGSSHNVSKAFSAVHRGLDALDPAENISGFGSEDLVGAITEATGALPSFAPTGALTDGERNVCAVVDATTRERITGSSGEVVYGRLTLSEIILSGTLTFNGTTTVAGDAFTLFIDEVSAGDIIEDTAGNYYEVATTPVLQDELTLTTPALVSASGSGLHRRRFTLGFRTRSSPTTDSSFVVSDTVRFFFPMWRSVEQSQFDYLPLLSRGFEPVGVADATTSIAGKALLSPNAPEGKAGAIFSVQQGGSQVSQAHIHTLDFDGASSAGAGVVNVTQRGPTGPQGPPGAGGVPGPTGPQGPAGQGFEFSTPFAESGLYTHTSLGSGTQYGFNYTFPGNEVLFLTGGNSEWWSPWVFDADDHWQIDNISVVSGTECRIDCRVPTGATPAAEVRFFLNAATKA